MNDNKNNKDRDDWQKKYLTIAVYAFIVIAAGFAAVLIIRGIFDFFAQKRYSGIFKILTPIIYGFVIAYLLNPLLVFFEQKIFFKLRKKLRYALSLLATYILTAIILTLIILMVVPQAVSSIQQLATMATDLFSPYGNTGGLKIGIYLTNFADSLQDYIDGIGLDLNIKETFNSLVPGLENILNLGQTYITPMFNSLAAILYSTASGIFNIFLGILLSIYLLISKDKFIAQTKKLLFAFFPVNFSYRLVKVMRQTHEIFGSFITGKILDSLIVGIICFICMSVFNIKYAMLISAIIAITNIIPFFGPFLGAIPSLFFLAIIDIWQALWFLIFIFILQQIDGNIIGPKVVGSQIGLSSFWVICAILIMSGFFGLPGVFIGVPIFAVIYVLIKEYAESRLEKKGFPAKTEYYIRDISHFDDIADGGKKSKDNKSSISFAVRKAVKYIADKFAKIKNDKQ